MGFNFKQQLIKKNIEKNPSKINEAIRASTSISDNQVYPDFCLQASQKYSVFKEFRNNPNYTGILEHVSYEHGNDYINEIVKDNSFLLSDFIEEFKKNDEWGNPLTFNYGGIGTISPTTLRYIKVLSDLIKYFVNIQNRTFIEIGVGYGGQCRILMYYLKCLQYNLVDLKPVLYLAQRYLDNYPLNGCIEYKTMHETKKQKYDFIISNYAFTELNRCIQDIYLDKIILNSNSGYITYNQISSLEFNSYTKEELLTILPNAPRIIEEKPLTCADNCIIIWGE